MTQFERNHHAKILRSIHNLLMESKETKKPFRPSLLWVPLLAIITLIVSCNLAHAQPIVIYGYSDAQICAAIYKAEGGKRAIKPYGIESTSCSGTQGCKKVCENTIRNDRKRYKDYGHKNYRDFISFVGSRYCPTHGRGLRPAERKLNGAWVKNVKWFLEHSKKG